VTEIVQMMYTVRLYIKPDRINDCVNEKIALFGMLSGFVSNKLLTLFYFIGSVVWKTISFIIFGDSKLSFMTSYWGSPPSGLKTTNIQ